MMEKDAKVKCVQNFYNDQVENEWNRLERNPVEYAVTTRILEIHLPSAPAEIFDLGGGPGRYSLDLLKRGYQVTLADLSPENISFATKLVSENGFALEDALVIDASQPSPFPEGKFDAILMMGPLYHLITLEECQGALQEALRILKPGGILFASFISLFGALRAVLANDPDTLEQEWKTMQHGINNSEIGFTEAYFARVPEILSLMNQQNFEQVEILGVEGFSVGLQDNFTDVDPQLWPKWAKLNLEFGRSPYAIEASDHILYVGRKALNDH